jgi:hypothetical protein
VFQVVSPSLGDLASAGVACADEQYIRLVRHVLSQPLLSLFSSGSYESIKTRFSYQENNYSFEYRNEKLKILSEKRLKMIRTSEKMSDKV